MRTILVPLDGSEFAEHALPLALGIARRAEMGLALVGVHEPPPPLAHGIGGAPGQDLAFDQQRDATMRVQRRRYLDGLGEQLHASDADVPVTVVLLEGPPAATLADYVRAAAPDLVVMTTHGRGGASRLWLGSVTEELVRRTTIPVLALRPPAGRAEPGSVRELRHVLVAVDGSVESEAVIAPVVALFGHAGKDYTLLRVVPPLHPIVRAVATDSEYSRDLGQEQRLATRYLEGLADRLHDTGVDTSLLTRCNVAPVDGIVAVADELGVDVIALATHGRGPVGRFVFGSVADKVLRTASTAVLLYHAPHGHAAEPPQEEIASASGAPSAIVASSHVEIYVQ